MRVWKTKEALGRGAFAFSAVLCLICVLSIFAFLIYKSLPAFSEIGFFNFILGDNWSPDRLDTFGKEISGSYGVLPMIAGTAAATAGAVLFGGAFGFFTSVFICFYCPKRLVEAFSFVINILAGIPSVVYGFFGLSFLLPILSNFARNNGSGLLATSLILGIMILPTVVSLSCASLNAVPKGYYDGSLALGADKNETVFRIIIPSARSGIIASLVLGIGRALGETMAVVMISGNAPAFPRGLFSPFRTLTANIVMEMGYAGELQEGALVATGVVLLIFVLAVNLAFSLLFSKASKEKQRSSFGSLFFNKALVLLGKLTATVSGIAVIISLFLILGFIIAKGLPTLLAHPSIIFGKYELGSENITVFPAIVTTLYTVIISLALSLPIGIMTAIYLNEYSRKNSPVIKAVRMSIDILAGVPSIVYGLFGMITFVALLGGKSSILAGSLTISLMLLPTIVRSSEEALLAVDNSLREGSLALGAGKLRTIFKIVIPSALPAIISAVILSMGRAVSESAPFLYTAGSVISSVPKSIFDSGATLSVALYQLSGEGWYMDEAYATAVVLIALVLLLNLLAVLLGKKLQKKLLGGNSK